MSFLEIALWIQDWRFVRRDPPQALLDPAAIPWLSVNPGSEDIWFLEITTEEELFWWLEGKRRDWSRLQGSLEVDGWRHLFPEIMWSIECCVSYHRSEEGVDQLRCRGVSRMVRKKVKRFDRIRSWARQQGAARCPRTNCLLATIYWHAC